MLVLPTILAAVFAVHGIANEESIPVHKASLGFGWTLPVASIFAVPSTVLHVHIRRKWNQNMATGA